ncbi:MAG: metallophosphoesterase family protein, partial [Chloroflexia bacterium]
MTRNIAGASRLRPVLFALLLPVLLAIVTGRLASRPQGTGAQSLPTTNLGFAVIGDYGAASYPEEGQVAAMIHSWNPDLVITVGDNNYEDGFAADIDPNIGQYFHDYIFPYSGSYGPGATTNKFFPSLGNHDWGAAGNPQPYYNYFSLPNNERYYDFASGPVHFFAIDADPNEPDGNTSGSVQANWLRTRLASATEPWKIVYFHQPPYSS